MWKCECRFVVRVVVIWEGVRERRGRPFTVPAVFIRIVGGPSWGEGGWVSLCWSGVECLWEGWEGGKEQVGRI